MRRKPYRIQIEHVEDDGLWIAMSDDIKGLTLQADTLPELIAEIEEYAPMLIAENHAPKHKASRAAQIRCDIPLIAV